MTLDLGDVGRTAAELMDVLAEDLEAETNPRVDMVAIVVAVSTDEWSGIRYRCSDRRPWIQRAVLAEALELAEQPDDDDERGDTLD